MENKNCENSLEYQTSVLVNKNQTLTEKADYTENNQRECQVQATLDQQNTNRQAISGQDQTQSIDQYISSTFLRPLIKTIALTNHVCMVKVTKRGVYNKSFKSLSRTAHDQTRNQNKISQ